MALNPREVELLQYLNKKVFEPPVIDTVGGIRQYTANLSFPSEEAFISYIAGKRVLDIGSGRGCLAKECALRDIEAEIISVNPRLKLANRRNQEKSITRLKYIRHSEQDRRNAQNAHDRRAIAAYVQLLPFLSETFDVILDSDAILLYADSQDELAVGIREEWRVLKPGGRMRMGWTFLERRHLAWEMQVLEGLQIPFELIFSKNRFFRLLQGVRALEATKPAVDNVR